MPLKPIFDKAPLTAMTCQALRPGMVRSEHLKLKHLAALLADDTTPQALEPAFRLACLLQADPDQSAAAAAIRRTLAAQKEDGSFDMPLCDAVAALRACWALYEYEARKPLLEHIARWCTWAVQNWEAIVEDDALWANPADLLELLEHLYRVTGKAAILSMVNRMSKQSMNWAGVLNTISMQRPTMREIEREELDARLADVNADNREGYYQRFVRVNSPEMLADGARASLARGWISGSATELNATRTGWEKLQRHHGAVCGGLTSDELLEGTSPSAAVSSAAVGAWAEALCSAATVRQGDWAFDAVERIALNAMPDCICEDGVRPFQRVNALQENPGEQDCFFVTAGHARRALYRMARGCAAVAAAAVMARQDGFAVNMFIPGRYQVPVGDAALMLTLRMVSGECTIQVSCKQPVKAIARLRVPAWTRNTEITINGVESDAGRDASAACMTIERTWNDGDVIAVTLEESLRVEEGHHQGRYVLRGARVMCLPVENEWAYALVSVTEGEEGIEALVDRVAGWKSKGCVPADVPVLPAPSGDAPVRVKLVPYAGAGARIAFFPGRSKA